MRATNQLHSLSQTDPKLNVYARDFQPSIPGSHNIGEWNLDSNDESAYSQLKLLRVKHFNRIIIAHLNINSIRNKFDTLSDLIQGNLDLLLVSETKIDCSFPTTQFLIPGFSSPFRLDRSKYGGGLLLC